MCKNRKNHPEKASEQQIYKQSKAKDGDGTKYNVIKKPVRICKTTMIPKREPKLKV
jgi:hypothetical protein